MTTIQPPQERRPPITPQLAVRVAVLGGVALTLFGIVFFRLWFLQVLSGDEYVAEARGNRVRNLTIAAPRGEMVDRNGTVLVENRRAVAVVVSPPKLPQDADERHRLLARLSRILAVSTKPQRCEIGERVERLMDVECLVEQGIFQLPYADVRIKTDAKPAVYSYLGERLQELPGVSIETVFLRNYPYETVGAQLFGTIGQISEEELSDERYDGVKGGTLIGKSGLEWTYDRYLRGIDGATRVQVDAYGRAQGELRRREPVPGNNLKLSIDFDLQRVGQEALAQGMALARGNGNAAPAGAFVALDPRNGEVLAMGSAPSFDPNILTRPITKREYDRELGEAADYPQINRAIAGEYPVGSTFKVITAAAALATGVITSGTPYLDTGTYTQGAIERQNAGGEVYGTVTLPTALARSVDTFFYYLGERLNADPTRHPNGGQLQAWARKFGMGKQTGVDIGGERSGTIPSAAWREERWKAELACRKRERVPNCYYADDRPWSVGDNSNLAVGQGDFLATPLQMAVAYAALQNGGTIVRPHVGLQITDADNRVLERIAPKPARKIEIPELTAIQEGLRAAANDAGGTSVDVFADFPHEVHGKTGTAETSKGDQSWYVAYVDDPVKPIVVAATVEQGGFGAEAAAPAVRLILSQWFGVAQKVVAGESQTA